MGVFDVGSKGKNERVTISCCNCREHYDVIKPRALKKNKLEKAHWEFQAVKEDINNLYVYKYSEVLYSRCPICSTVNYAYLNKDMDIEVSEEKPEDTLLAKELLEHWIEKS
jgi:cytochrome c1